MFQTVRFIQMMSLTFGLFTQVSGSGPLGPLVIKSLRVLDSKKDQRAPSLRSSQLAPYFRTSVARTSLEP